MFWILNAVIGLGRTQFPSLSIAGVWLRLGSLLAVTLTLLLSAASWPVHAQTETETISPPLEVQIPHPAASARAFIAPPPPTQESAPLDVVTIGLNFQGSELLVDSFSIPPDTMGAVGPSHIVEMINGRFDVYNKTTGAQVFTRSLNEFWTTVAGLTIPSGDRTFDPRIVYDLASGRWIATSIDGGVGGASNNIYLARSDSSDPTGDWDGVRFQADTVNVVEFHDYDTLAVDADGVYICTNDFPGGIESCYSIPKADILQATPTISRLTRFEETPAGLPSVTGSIQPALDFGPSDGRAALVGVSLGGTLVRGDILGAGGASASLGSVVNIAGAPFTSEAPPARQPHPSGFTIENVSPRIVANVFEQGNSLWAVHAVAGSFGNSAVRWYEINESTNTVLQTGLIEDPDEDYHEPSIAVNEFGNVVIGYTCSGPSLAPAACVSVGETVGVVTTFENPLVLQPGAGHYYQTGSGTRNRWGDYSATVIDPADPCTFWTFQEFVAVSAVGDVGGSWGIQITELIFKSCGVQEEDLVYTPVTPCRIVDTRLAGGAFEPGSVRGYNVRGAVASQGGNAAGCPSPRGEPRAVHINVTAVPLGNGNILAYPFGSAAPNASLVNYRSDAQNVANSGTIKTCFNCTRDINVKSNFGAAHVVIDVLGYYYLKP